MIDAEILREVQAQLLTEVRDMQAQTLSEVREVKRHQDMEWDHLAQTSAEDRKTIADAKRAIGIAGAILVILVLFAFVKMWTMESRLVTLEAAVYHQSHKEVLRDATAGAD